MTLVESRCRYLHRVACGIILLLCHAVAIMAQTPVDSVSPDTRLIVTESGDTLREYLFNDEATLEYVDTIHFDTLDVAVSKRSKRDWSTWRPDPKRALWLAIVVPGGGQIYNRKYWKLPIVYGGFVGCAYAMQWNNQMYHDYSQAYLDLADGNPDTQSYNQFLHLGTTITDKNKERYINIFKKRKDYYRRYRDLSFFILVGVYALSVIDAYVDASLSDFDISKDLTLSVSPTVLTNRSERNPVRSSALGVQCSLKF